MTELSITAQQTNFKSRSQCLVATKSRGWEGKDKFITPEITKLPVQGDPITKDAKINITNIRCIVNIQKDEKMAL